MVQNSKYEIACDNIMFMNNERHSDMIRSQRKEAIRRKRQVLLSSGVCLHHVTVRNHTARHTLKEIQDSSYIWKSATFTRFGTQTYSFLLASKRRSMRKWTSLQIPRGGEGGGSCLVGTGTKIFLSRGIYALVERRRVACRTWWGLGSRLMSLCCICFAIHNIM